MRGRAPQYPPRPLRRRARRFWSGSALLLAWVIVLSACGQVATPTPAPATAAAPAPTVVPTPTVPPTRPATPAVTATVTPTAALTPTAGAATPTRAAAATPASSACPVTSGACAVAERLNDWLTRRDIDALVAATRAEPFDCPGPRPTGAGGPFPLCEGSTAGERRTGYSITYFQGERSVVSEAGYRTFLRGWLETVAPNRRDSVGEGRLRLSTVGCPQAMASATPPCPGLVAIVFSAIREGQGMPGPTRFALLFFVQPERTPPIDRPGTAMTQINDPALLSGGTVTDFPWPAGPAGPGRFFRLTGLQ